MSYSTFESSLYFGPIFCLRIISIAVLIATLYNHVEKADLFLKLGYDLQSLINIS